MCRQGLTLTQQLKVLFTGHADCPHVVLDDINVDFLIFRNDHGPLGAVISQDMMRTLFSEIFTSIHLKHPQKGSIVNSRQSWHGQTVASAFSKDTISV